jgi:hypothetical protein
MVVGRFTTQAVVNGSRDVRGGVAGFDDAGPSALSGVTRDGVLVVTGSTLGIDRRWGQ